MSMIDKEQFELYINDDNVELFYVYYDIDEMVNYISFNIKLINMWLNKHVQSWWFSRNFILGQHKVTIWFGDVDSCEKFIQWIQSQPFEKGSGII